jgi:hypothetical protein
LEYSRDAADREDYVTNPLPDYTSLVDTAVGVYWDVRRSQAARSEASGVLNPGLRSEVTGGRHLDDLQLLVRVFIMRP